MNLLLQINKKIIFLIICILIILFTFILFIKINKINDKKFAFDIDQKTSYDILKPKFIINNSNEIINISANQGNFINANEVLLQNNVLFESNKFKIFSNNVLFDKTNQTANSKSDSTFISKKTTIKGKELPILFYCVCIHCSDSHLFEIPFVREKLSKFF